MPVAEMLSRMDAREMVFWKAYARIEHQEYEQRKLAARAESEGARVKAQRPRLNRGGR